MQKIAILWVLGLVGCTPVLAADLLRVSLIGAASGFGERSHPEPICADVAAGPALNACFAAHGVRSAQLAEVALRREAARAQATCVATAIDATGERQFDRELVATGLASAHSNVVACGDALAARGEVVLQMTVASTGCVTAIAIESAPNRELGACVAAALQRASFEPTQTGGTFRYRYDY